MARQGLEQKIKLAAKRILAADRILIASHINPDGDAIGSQIGLGLGLLNLGKRVVMVSPDGFPRRYQFLPGSELVLTHCKTRPELAIAVDCGSVKQIGRLAPVFRQARSTIQIDHHDFGDSFCKLLVVEPEAAAVGEIIFHLLKELNIKITASIATCLLTSIIVDTGAFRFANIRGETFRVCADLLECGVDLKHLLEDSYWKKSLATVRLEAKSVQKMKLEAGGKLIWTLVSQHDFRKVNGLVADADGVTDDLRAIDGVRVAALIRETEDSRYRVSLRSAYGINVAEVAQVFGGGGHHNAAGCSMRATKRNRDRLIQLLINLVE